MASATTELREALLASVGAPFDFSQVRDTFGTSAAAADFLGLRRAPKGASPERRADMNRRRATFQQSWGRWSRGARQPTGGAWPRLRDAAERLRISRDVRRHGLIIYLFSGEIDVYGSDFRDREIEVSTVIEPEELTNAGGHNFYRSVESGDWTGAARAVATAWFTNYIGNDLAGGDASWGDVTDLQMAINYEGEGE